MALPLAAILSAAALAPALAGELWIEAGPAPVEPGGEVVVRLYDGDPFAGSEQPYRAAAVGLFQRLWRAGRANLAGVEGAPPLARFRVDEPGVQVIVYNDGGARAFGKALLVVGDAPEGDPLRYSELGQRLEIVPQSDPVELLRRGGTLEVQVLFEREPLAGARVVAVPAADPSNGLEAAITDEIGLARLRLGRAGRWLVRVRHRPGDETRISSTLTLDAAAPR
jgi:hypothetical protein